MINYHDFIQNILQLQLETITERIRIESTLETCLCFYMRFYSIRKETKKVKCTIKTIPLLIFTLSISTQTNVPLLLKLMYLCLFKISNFRPFRALFSGKRQIKKK